MCSRCLTNVAPASQHLSPLLFVFQRTMQLLALNACHLYALAMARDELQRATPWKMFQRAPSDRLSFGAFLYKLWRAPSAFRTMLQILRQERTPSPAGLRHEEKESGPTVPDTTPNRRLRPSGGAFCHYFDTDMGTFCRPSDQKHSPAALADTASLCVLCGHSKGGQNSVSRSPCLIHTRSADIHAWCVPSGRPNQASL